MIQVCYLIHDKDGLYSKFTGTSMLSMFENYNGGGGVTVNILHDNTLTQDNKDKFCQIADQYNQQIKFYNVEELFADKIVELDKSFPDLKTSRISIGTFYRLFIMDVFPQDIEKVICLDSDIIVNLDINELWQIELENEPLAAVPSSFFIKKYKETNWNNPNSLICRNGIVKWEDYFNSGVMLMNLKILRNEKETVSAGIKYEIEFGEKVTIKDQDIFNYCFASRAKKIPVKFNSLVRHIRMNNIQEIEISSRIYHYTSGSVSLLMEDVYNKLWWEYYKKTPWTFDENSLVRIDNELRKILRNIYIKQKKIARDVSVMLAGKVRVFYIPAENLEQVKNIFEIGANEEIILADENDSVEKLIESMKKFADKKAYFVMQDDEDQYQKLSAVLIEAGFIEDKNFMNARKLMIDKQGKDFNSYQLLKLL